MNLNKNKLRDEIIKLIDSAYVGKIEDIGFISFYSTTPKIEKRFRFRLQFDNMLTYEGYSAHLKEVEFVFLNLISDDLKKYYDSEMSFSINKFYKTDYDFCQEIRDEYHLQNFLSEFLRCYKFYETEIFPKLTDIRFLADYVGSMPFEQSSEIVVGGSFPLQLFKKIAILKWGNHPRYEEYKDETQKLIELYAIKKPEKAEEVRLFQKGFEKLIYHLENEPNPFL